MNNSNAIATLAGNREITITRVFDAPQELVFRMWSKPSHIGQWWGPIGFTTTTYNMEFKSGGVWSFVMHGPDGTDYKNKITYVEVVEPRRLVYKHCGDEDRKPVNFEATVTFADEGGKTKLTMRMIFPTASARDYVVNTHGAVDGLTQTISRLGKYLEKVA